MGRSDVVGATAASRSRQDDMRRLLAGLVQGDDDRDEEMRRGRRGGRGGLRRCKSRAGEAMHSDGVGNLQSGLSLL